MSTGEPDRRSSRWVVGAWVCVALIPIVLVAVSYAAVVFFRETRYEGASHYVPEWAHGMPWPALLLQAAVSVAIVAIPCVLAVWCGRRAVDDGDRRGRAPQLVGTLALVGYALMCAASFFANLM